MPSVHHPVRETSPFEQIRAVEERQNARVEQQKKHWETQTVKEVERITKEEEKEEEKIRAKMQEELNAFAAKEPAAILQKAQSEGEREATAAEQTFTTHAPSVIESLTADALDPSLVS